MPPIVRGSLRLFVNYCVRGFSDFSQIAHRLARPSRAVAVTSLTSAAIWSSLFSLASRARRRLLLVQAGSMESLRLGFGRRLLVIARWEARCKVSRVQHYKRACIPQRCKVNDTQRFCTNQTASQVDRGYPFLEQKSGEVQHSIPFDDVENNHRMLQRTKLAIKNSCASERKAPSKAERIEVTPLQCKKASRSARSYVVEWV